MLKPKNNRRPIVELIIGISKQFPIDHRFLNGACCISSVSAAAIVINNAILGLDLYLNLIIGSASIFFFVLYFFSRIKGMYLFPLWGLTSFFIIAFPPAWFLNSGLFGSTIHVCFVILTIIVVIARGKMRIIIALVFISEIIGIIGVEYYYPSLVVQYGNRHLQFIDIIINLTASLAMLVLIIHLVMKNYEEEKIKADEANRLKSFFLANISHEIRTPMNSILGFSELLRDQNLPGTDRGHYIDIIRKSGNHLLGLIDDIIDLSRIEAGELHLREGSFNLDAMMKELYEIFSLQIREGGRVNLILDTAETGEGVIIADEIRLRQVLMNLLGNAFKFTQSGKIVFGYRLSGPGWLRFHVTDTGIGIDPQARSHIFDQFKQADEGHTREYGGAGLGLAISKKLINLMGGEIWLKSETGQGSAFFFEITFRKPRDTGETAKPGRIPAAGKIEGRAHWRDRTILIVEDNDDSFHFLQRVLTRHEIRVIRAVNGIEAIEACRNNPSINCVLMDIQLPRMSGYEAAGKIRSLRSDLPIIAQSGNAFDADREASLRAGCNEFISKPILIDTLLSVLDKYL